MLLDLLQNSVARWGKGRDEEPILRGVNTKQSAAFPEWMGWAEPVDLEFQDRCSHHGPTRLKASRSSQRDAKRAASFRAAVSHATCRAVAFSPVDQGYSLEHCRGISEAAWHGHFEPDDQPTSPAGTMRSGSRVAIEIRQSRCRNAETPLASIAATRATDWSVASATLVEEEFEDLQLSTSAVTSPLFACATFYSGANPGVTLEPNR